MATVKKNQGDNQQRAFVRVDDYLPMSWRRVDPEEFAEIISNFEKKQNFPAISDDIQSVLVNLEVTDKIQVLERTDPVLARILSR
ncbi:MAG TPA: hypothetical protein HPQ00_13400, partial [Magnetococcales bacterium]|nr:hypothetical protein [Magnetococcales bacterium]